VNIQTLSAEQAFRAMVFFLQQYYERGGKRDDFAAVVSDIPIEFRGRYAGRPGGMTRLAGGGSDGA
jgi:hypothetical protein